MAYQIALSPELGLTPADFVTAWNADSECRKLAEVRLSPPAAGTSFDPTIMNVAIDLLIALGTNVTSSAIYDLVKKLLEKKGKPGKHTHMLEMKKPDGTQIVVVDIDEK
jgi:hypothetical protein